jgi:GT2 family glycosyltransferase
LKKFDLVFIVTFQDLDNIFNLIETINLNSKLNLLTILINQSGSFISIFNTSYSSFIEIIVDKNSLSFCRNVAVDYLLNNKIEFDHIMFPDDDTTFNNAFFDNFKSIVSLKRNYLLDVYNKGTSDLYVSNSLTDGTSITKNKFHIAMSVNMIISKQYFDSVLYFDEKLGVGAAFGSAEDTDYFLRIVNLSGNFIYTKQLYNFHPSPKNKYKKLKLNTLIIRFINYGNGILFALCKHKMYIASLLVCIRAIGGSILSLLRLNFKLSIAYFISFLFRCAFMFKLLLNKNV